MSSMEILSCPSHSTNFLKTFHLLSFIIMDTSGIHDHISIHGLAQIHDLA